MQRNIINETLTIMKNQMRYFAWMLLLFPIEYQEVSAQCTPPMAETCEESSVLCSLNELDGYACYNASTVSSPCSPLCSQGGVGHNTSWWGFVSRGGKATITLIVGGCIATQGLEYGIWGDCVCGDEVICRSVPCLPQNTVSTINVNLKPCKTYYLWIDGCHGDICDFTLSTKGDSAPSLQPLPRINNDTDGIIGPLCEGQCNAKFFVNAQPGLCEPTYVWTLDGNEVGGNDTIVSLDFPVEGNFVICVTAYVGNPKSGSICSQEGPQCATIQVRKTIPNIINRKAMCWELFNNHKGDTICISYPNGRYRCIYRDSNCCKIIDSGKVMLILPVPVAPDVYYITCDNQPYIDILGRSWNPCKDYYNITLPNTTDPFKCDSSINLTAVNVEFTPRWRAQCFGGQVEISPNISIVKPCSVGETYEFEYRWYNKNDIAKKTISTDERLLIDAKNEDYCLEVNVKIQLETEFALCAKTFCETFNEGDLMAPITFPLAGDISTCANGIGNYWIDTFLSQKVLFFTWTIDGGFIASKVDSQRVTVKWLLQAGDTGTVCVYYDTDCGISPEKCIKVSIVNESAGKDFKQKGVIAKLNSPSSKLGIWKKVSGPGNVIFENINSPKSRVRVDVYGLYCFEWSVNGPDCISKDTVCIDFYKIKTTDPDFPHKVFDDRNYYSNKEDKFNCKIFTPNLISNSGTSYLSIEGEFDAEIKYHWFDIFGKLIFNDYILFEAGAPHININSPMQEGFYFIVIEINGVPSVRKVCVIGQ